jgi:LysM repeat protein
MAGRSPARFLAPLALIAFAVAAYVVVSNDLKTDKGSGSSAKQERTTSSTKKSSTKHRRRSGRRTYTVKSGDTASAIAAKYGLTLSQLRKLNPKLDPASLSPGQKLRLRR